MWTGCRCWSSQGSDRRRERWFLCTRFLRRAVKTGFVREAKTFALEQEPKLWSLVLQAFIAIKRVSNGGAQRSA